MAHRLAETLGWAFEEGDSLHPPANVAKMREGIPLMDSDRAPWLAKVAEWVDDRVKAGQHGIITCSALKRAYRTQIVGGHPEVKLVYLHADRAVLQQHVDDRHHEYMPATLLDSQLATLERPGADEPVISVDVGGTVDATVAEVMRQIEAAPAA